MQSRDKIPLWCMLLEGHKSNQWVSMEGCDRGKCKLRSSCKEYRAVASAIKLRENKEK